jgi:hypothetical protein
LQLTLRPEHPITPPIRHRDPESACSPAG